MDFFLKKTLKLCNIRQPMQSENNLLFFLCLMKIKSAILDEEMLMVPVLGLRLPFYFPFLHTENWVTTESCA